MGRYDCGEVVRLGTEERARSQKGGVGEFSGVNLLECREMRCESFCCNLKLLMQNVNEIPTSVHALPYYLTLRGTPFRVRCLSVYRIKTQGGWRVDW